MPLIWGWGGAVGTAPLPIQIHLIARSPPSVDGATGCSRRGIWICVCRVRVWSIGTSGGRKRRPILSPAATMTRPASSFKERNNVTFLFRLLKRAGQRSACAGSGIGGSEHREHHAGPCSGIRTNGRTHSAKGLRRYLETGETVPPTDETID